MCQAILRINGLLGEITPLIINEEDRRAFAQLGDRETFATLVAARQRAEEVANKTRSQRILVRLGNSKARQPLRSFEIADLVMVWRQVLPLEVHTGPRGGMKKSSKPGWVGPGRVIFTEMLPHQDQDDHRRHIVWFLLHGKLLRCSVHSVRPVTPTEKLHHEIHRKEDITKWKSLSDLLPRGEFQDITDEVPSPDQLELPHLPSKPDDTTVIPARRPMVKKTLFEKDWKTIHRLTPLEARQRLKVLDLDLHHLDLMRRAQSHMNLIPLSRWRRSVFPKAYGE